MEEKIDGIYRVIVERENALRLLRLALEEMNPRCENCEHFSKYDKGGTCYSVCKWQHEEEARKLLGEKEAEHENGNEQAAQWIPCSERLPEKDVEVLVAIYGTDYHFVNVGETLADAVERDRQTFRTVTVAHLSDEGWNGADWLPLMVLPTYWMPKPEAPDPPKLEKLPECKGMTPKEWREKFQAMLNDDSDEPEV